MQKQVSKNSNFYTNIKDLELTKKNSNFQYIIKNYKKFMLFNNLFTLTERGQKVFMK